MTFLIISFSSSLFPLIFSKSLLGNRSRKYKLVFIYILASFIFNIINFVFYYFNKNNLVTILTFGILEFILLTSFYRNIIFLVNKIISFLIYSLLIAIFVSISIVSYSNTLLKVPSFAFSSFVLIILILISLFKMLNDKTIVNYGKNLDFWLNISFLIYFAGTFLLFLSTIIIHDEQILKNMWIINNSLSLTTNLLISFGLWKTR